jgi:1-acyl-sn-glycerol-3-phosphate acyltransferase
MPAHDHPGVRGPADNSHMESFFHSLKAELTRGVVFSTDAALRTALGFLAEGRTLGIFPEGTRRKEGVSPQAKSGAALLAARSGATVLPVFADKIPGPAARLRGERFRVYIGNPLTTYNTAKGKEGYRRVADEILRTIYALPRERL